MTPDSIFYLNIFFSFILTILIFHCQLIDINFIDSCILLSWMLMKDYLIFIIVELNQNKKHHKYEYTEHRSETITRSYKPKTGFRYE